MESLLKNKKGQGTFMVWFLVLAVLLTLSIFLLVANYSWDKISTPLSESLSTSMSEDDFELVNGTINNTSSGLKFFDSTMPFLLIGLFGFISIAAGSIMKSPVFIFVGIIVMAVVFLLASVYSNVYEGIADSDQFKETSDGLTIQYLFMRYLPLILLVVVVLVIIFSAVSGSKGGGL